MSTAVTTTNGQNLGSIETVLATGDLAGMNSQDRTRYLLKICETLGLNPYTRPFQYITLSGKLTLYATRDATEQLRKIHGVSIRIAARDRSDDLYIVQAEATDRTGRVDTSLGVVSLAGLRGEALANALMKCETKAKRRVTLSICGLGMLDETEVETVPGAVAVAQPPVALPVVETVEGDLAEQRRPAAAVSPPPDPLRVARAGLAGAREAARLAAEGRGDPDPFPSSLIAARVKAAWGIDNPADLKEYQLAELRAWVEGKLTWDGEIRAFVATGPVPTADGLLPESAMPFDGEGR